MLSYSVTGGDDGSTSHRYVRASYNNAGTDAGLPETMFAKSTRTLTSRLLTGMAGALAAEAGFYTMLRPKLDIEAPRAFHAQIDEKSYRSIFLLEDVRAARGAVFGNPTSLYVDRPMAESMITNIAAYHGRYWDSPDLHHMSFPPTSLEFQARANSVTDFRKRTLVGVDRAEHLVPREFLLRRKDAFPAAMRSLQLNSRAPWTLLHSDVHIGNWYVAEDGAMGLYDWLLMTRGQWALDLAYALMSALTVEDRRSWEGDLLRLYLDKVTCSGGAPPSFAEAWLRYRQQTMHCLIFWLFTLGSGVLQPQMQPKAVSETNVVRMTQAVVDLEFLDSPNE